MFGLNSRDNDHGRGADALSLPTPRFAGGAIGRGGIFGNTPKTTPFFPLDPQLTHRKSPWGMAV